MVNRNSSTRCFLIAHHDDGCREVDLHDGVHTLRIRETHHPIVHAHLGDLLGRVGRRKPRERVLCGNCSVASHEPTEKLLVVVNRPTCLVAQRVLEQRVALDWGNHAMTGLNGVRDRTLPFVEIARMGMRRPVKRSIFLPSPTTPVHALRAGQDRDFDLATDDSVRDRIEQVSGRIATGRDRDSLDARRHCCHLCDGCAQVVVWPCNGINARQERCSGWDSVCRVVALDIVVVDCPVYRLRHHLGGLPRLKRPV